MIKKTITYTGSNGETFTEDFYFNLSRAEILRMNFTTAGGDLEVYIKKIANERDTRKLWDLFEELILKSHGEPGVDGRGFPKDPEKTKRFRDSEAFSELLVELLSVDGAADKFVNGVVGRPVVGSAAPQDHKPAT